MISLTKNIMVIIKKKRIDMSTNDFAIVVEYTRYWKLSFGLVLWYDFQSN